MPGVRRVRRRESGEVHIMSIGNDKIVGAESNYTLKVMTPDDPQDDPRIAYREGGRVLRGSLESHWSLSVSVNWTWEPPHAGEPIPQEKREQIEKNIIAALEQQGYHYYHF